MTPKNDYARAENTNICVALGKKLNFSLVGIAGKDIVDGNRKFILALVWQMMKLHVFTILSKINKKFASGEPEEMIHWANQRVKASGKDTQMKDFKDSSLSTGKFLIDLLNAIKPRVVDYHLVTPGVSGKQEEIYCILH
jgi:plastin-1